MPWAFKHCMGHVIQTVEGQPDPTFSAGPELGEDPQGREEGLETSQYVSVCPLYALCMPSVCPLLSLFMPSVYGPCAA